MCLHFLVTNSYVISNDTVTIIFILNVNTSHAYFCTPKLPWAKARIKCKETGMDLVSLETEEENSCVISRLKTAGLHFAGIIFFEPLICNGAGRISNKVWHSLNMLGSPQFTYWGSGAELTYQTGWAAKNPAQFPNEACACFE
jgi:hypothetical protein